MSRQSDPERTQFLFFFFLLFYGVQLALSFFIPRMPPFIDFTTGVGILLVFYLIHRKHALPWMLPLCLGIGFLPHIIGLYQSIPYNAYYTGTLYGAPQLFDQYDLFVHSVGFGILALAFCMAARPYIKTTLPTVFTFAILLLCMVGFGALNEVLEYAGYTAFGYGEGFLEYGPGDYGPDKGPWKDAMQDLTANLFGGSLAILLYFRFRKTIFS